LLETIEALKAELAEANENKKQLLETTEAFKAELAEANRKISATEDEMLAEFNEKANEQAKKIEALEKDNEAFAKIIEELEAAAKRGGPTPVAGTYKKKKFKPGYTKVACPAGVKDYESAQGELLVSEDLIKAANGKDVEGLSKEKATAILNRLIEIGYGGFQ